MIDVAEATRRILGAVAPLPGEAVTLAEAHGRVLVAAVLAGRALPPFDNSAMDGFALRAADCPGELPVRGTIAAGAAPVALPPGAAMKIMTGAPLPAGADAVVMREDATERDGLVVVPAARAGQHIRRAGDDLQPGALALAPGRPLGPGELGLAAALGLTELTVARRPRVAILSTGDELVPLGAPLGPGQIASSNAVALAAQVIEAGGVPTSLGISGDRDDQLAAAIARAAGFDVLVSSGGVSVGDFDRVVPALVASGVTVEFHKVAMKPGKPVMFGRGKRGLLVFGLPGNPVSSLVGFELFVRPALRALQGAAACARPRATVAFDGSYRKDVGRSHYLRAALRRDGEVLWATPHARQGSGMLSSLVAVDALVELPAALTAVAPGDRVSALLLEAR